METKVLKTINWSECEALLKVLALKNLGQPKKGKITGFTDFVSSYQKVKRPQWLSFWQTNIQRHLFKDVTGMATLSEDSCLFSYQNDTALDIILRHLKTLNTGGKLDALWCFLDEDQKAIVHFVNNGGWYAEAFFACNEDFSVLHLIDTGNGLTFMPVVFATDITEQISQVEAEGAVVLHTYLPRETYAFLSNKSGKNPHREPVPLKKKKGVPETYRDKADLL